jgi:hypothetical protein
MDRLDDAGRTMTSNEFTKERKSSFPSLETVRLYTPGGPSVSLQLR